VNSPEQRLGARLDVSGLWVLWDISRVDRRSARERRRHPVEQQFGQVLNLSVSGAAIIAPAAPHLRPGSMIDIEAGGFKGMVAIHRIDEMGDPFQRVYGVSFVDFPPAFTDYVYAVLASARPDDLQDRWQRAR
jgi:hypothetical protein